MQDWNMTSQNASGCDLERRCRIASKWTWFIIGG